MSGKRRAQQLLLNWYEQLVFCYERELALAEKAELEAWERSHLDGVTGTSGWPAWERHIGKRFGAVKPGGLRRRA